MKRGLALEGGGAKGAYHIGVMKAFVEKGHEFDGFVGTSIGAINAAIFAQGDFQKALELWMQISSDQIFLTEEQPLLQLTERKGLNAELLSGVRGALPKVIINQGFCTKKMMDFLHAHIDEEKVRASGKDFGLVTVSLSERKPYELMLEDIPAGKLVSYIMASASFPGFSPVTIDGKKHLDGAFYNNCPVNLLDKLGYDEIIAVRTTNLSIVSGKMDKVKHVKRITPRENLGGMMQFSAEHSAANIRLGYYDGLRFIENLRGSDYYIRPLEADFCHAQLMALCDKVIHEAGNLLGHSGIAGKRLFFEKVIPSLGTHLKLHKEFDYMDFMIALLEQRAREKEIERFEVYDYHHLCSLVKTVPFPSRGKTKKLALTPQTLRKKAVVNLLIENLL